MNLVIAIAGTIVSLFLPGFLISLIFFRELKILERAIYSVVISVGIDVALGIALGYDKFQKSITGGISSFNLWYYQFIINAVLLIVIIFLYRKKLEDYILKRNQK
jgi:uncharacterized membrane protein